MSTTYHIVEKDGEIEIVHLDPVYIKTNSKPNQWIPAKHCTCVMCQTPEIKVPIKNAPSAEARVVKNYLQRKHVSRPKSTNVGTDGINVNSIHARTNAEHNGISVENGTDDPIVSVKTEPELEIIDVDDADVGNIQPERTIEEEINDASTVVNVPSAQTTQDYEMAPTSRTRTLQFQVKSIKCNICEMVFPANSQQETATKTHLLLHKNSVKRTFKCEICHKTLPDMDYLMIIQHKRSHDKNKINLLNNSLLPVNRCDSLRSYMVTEKKWRCSGSVASKQIRKTNSKVLNFNDRGVESDDDVQIIETKPELIVIDDNEVDMVRKPAKKVPNIRKISK